MTPKERIEHCREEGHKAYSRALNRGMTPSEAVVEYRLAFEKAKKESEPK